VGVALPALALLEPIAIAVHLQDVDVVGEAVEQRAGEPFGGEHASPLVERQIAGDDGRAALVALAEHLEQQFGAGLGQRHVAELVDYQKFVAGKLVLQAEQTFLVPGFDQFVHHGSRARAKANGRSLGRKPKLTPHQRREAIKRRDRDGEPVREIARSYNVHASTISRLVT